MSENYNPPSSEAYNAAKAFIDKNHGKVLNFIAHRDELAHTIDNQCKELRAAAELAYDALFDHSKSAQAYSALLKALGKYAPAYKTEETQGGSRFMTVSNPTPHEANIVITAGEFRKDIRLKPSEFTHVEIPERYADCQRFISSDNVGTGVMLTYTEA